MVNEERRERIGNDVIADFLAPLAQLLDALYLTPSLSRPDVEP